MRFFAEKLLTYSQKLLLFFLSFLPVLIFGLNVASPARSAEFSAIGSVRFEGQGEVGSPERVLRFFLSATIRATNDDFCSASGSETICIDYVRAYLTDGEDKIIGITEINVQKGQVRSGEVSIDLANKSYNFPYKFILTDIASLDAAKNIGDVHEDNKTQSAQNYSKTFDPTKLEGNKPEDWTPVEQGLPRRGTDSSETAPQSEGLNHAPLDVGSLRITGRPPITHAPLDVGNLRITGRPPITHAPLDVGNLRITGRPPISHAPLDVGNLRITGQSAISGQTIDVGELRVIDRSPETDRPINVGELRVVDRPPETNRTINVDELRVIDRSPPQTQNVNVGELRVIDRSPETDRTINVDELRVVDRPSETDRPINVGELRVIDRPAATDRTIDVDELRVVDRGERPPSGDRTVNAGELRIIGQGAATSLDRTVDAGELRIIGQGTQEPTTETEETPPVEFTSSTILQNTGGQINVQTGDIEVSSSIQVENSNFTLQGTVTTNSNVTITGAQFSIANNGTTRISGLQLSSDRPEQNTDRTFTFTTPVTVHTGSVRFALSSPVEVSGSLQVQGGQVQITRGRFQASNGNFTLSNRQAPFTLTSQTTLNASGSTLRVRGAQIEFTGSTVLHNGSITITGGTITPEPGGSFTISGGNIQVTAGRLITTDLTTIRQGVVLAENSRLYVAGASKIKLTGLAAGKQINAGELKVIGRAGEHHKIKAGNFRVIGTHRPRRFIRPGTLPGRVKVSLLRVRKLTGETNPFDPVELKADVNAAQEGTLGQTGTATALTVAGVPFTDFNQIFVNLNAGGTALSVDNVGATQVLDIQSTGGVLDIAVSPGFTQISASGGLTGLGGTVARTIVVRRNGDGVHFQLNVNITSTVGDVTLNTLTGSNCGASAGNCP